MRVRVARQRRALRAHADAGRAGRRAARPAPAAAAPRPAPAADDPSQASGRREVADGRHRLSARPSPARAVRGGRRQGHAGPDAADHRGDEDHEPRSRPRKAGTVTQILVEDGQPVEFGEPLMIIE